MKFAKLLEESQYGPWKEYYIDYGGTKSYIKRQTIEGAVRDENALQIVLERVTSDMKKVKQFKQAKQKECEIEVNKLLKVAYQLKVWKKSGFPDLDKNAQALQNDIQRVGKQLLHLIQYLELNIEGIRKLLKKLDKYTHQSAGNEYLIKHNDKLNAICDSEEVEKLVKEIQRALKVTAQFSDKKHSTSTEYLKLKEYGKPVNVACMKQNSSRIVDLPSAGSLQEFVFQQFPLYNNDISQQGYSLLPLTSTTYGTTSVEESIVENKSITSVQQVKSHLNVVAACVHRINVALIVPILFLEPKFSANSSALVPTALTLLYAAKLLSQVFVAYPSDKVKTTILVGLWFCFIGNLLLWAGLLKYLGNTKWNWSIICGCTLLGFGSLMDKNLGCIAPKAGAVALYKRSALVTLSPALITGFIVLMWQFLPPSKSSGAQAGLVFALVWLFLFTISMSLWISQSRTETKYTIITPSVNRRKSSLIEALKSPLCTFPQDAMHRRMIRDQFCIGTALLTTAIQTINMITTPMLLQYSTIQGLFSGIELFIGIQIVGGILMLPTMYFVKVYIFGVNFSILLLVGLVMLAATLTSYASSTMDETATVVLVFLSRTFIGLFASAIEWGCTSFSSATKKEIGNDTVSIGVGKHIGALLGALFTIYIAVASNSSDVLLRISSEALFIGSLLLVVSGLLFGLTNMFL